MRVDDETPAAEVADGEITGSQPGQAAINEAKREPVALADDGAEEPGDGTRKMRTWTDASGQNKIEALFIEFASGKVRLRTRNGQFLSLKLDQLSPADRKYVMRRVQR